MFVYRIISIDSNQGTSDQIVKNWQQKLLAQKKVLKPEKYCMYFPVSELHGWSKRFAVQSQTTYSEVP